MGESPRVFISYSHDREAHLECVLSLSERLRADGVDCYLDQYVNGSPQEGWPRWMLDQIDRADYVLLVCTKSYYRRFRGHEVIGAGLGVDWEGTIITQEMYDSRSAHRFIPVLLQSDDYRFIPEPVRSSAHYNLSRPDAYAKLRAALLQQAGVEPGPLGKPVLTGHRRGRPLLPPGADADVHEYATAAAESLAKTLDHYEQVALARTLLAERRHSICFIECCSEDWPQDLADHIQSTLAAEAIADREFGALERQHGCAISLSLAGRSGRSAFMSALSAALPRSKLGDGEADRDRRVRQWLAAAGFTVVFMPLHIDREGRALMQLVEQAHEALIGREDWTSDARVLVLFAVIRPRSWWTPLWWRWGMRRKLRRHAHCRELPRLRCLEAPDIDGWHAAFPATLRSRFDRDRVKDELLELFRTGRRGVKYLDARRCLVGFGDDPGALQRAKL